jgi:hypothetical protein
MANSPWIRHVVRSALVVAGALASAGCEDRDTGAEPSRNVFISDDPTRLSESDGGNVGSTSTGTGTGSGGGGAEGGNSPGTPPEDPERLIAEADIVQIHDDKLYALSQYSGLSIIDVSNDQLSILGRKKLGGDPFEMYLVDGVVYAMFRNWGEYKEVEGSWQWVTTSHVEALQTSDPSNITTIGTLEVPGYLADSRLVGDVLYTVSMEDGYCWGCNTEATTTVTSFEASDPTAFAVLDQVELADEGADWGWSRSITVTTDRIYIGGMESEQGSTIDVVDISDPNGALVVGAKLDVAGRIQSRWQMDEYEGVLRVISQPWDPSVNPSIQTFTVSSASDITPLGTGSIQIPKPESLRAVRFDGLKAYAITAEQIDPLFTIDLSDPANPVQRGELEIPGWIYHIEPRAERLLTLGFDPADTNGSLHVSLFDVSDLDTPSLIRRIPFGGDWGNFAEDQDRIHKAFKILPDLGLLAIPFSAWEWDDWGCGNYESGIQLVDWANDDLVKRGVAPIRGDARRAFVHAGRLYGMSDELVRSFSLADRDNPVKVAELLLSTHVSQVLVEGAHAVRLAADWWTNEPRLEIVSAADPASDTPIGTLDLAPMLAAVEEDESCYAWSYWQVRMFAHENTVYLVWPGFQGEQARVATVDISNPASPTLLAHIDVPVDAYNYGGSYWYGYGQIVVSTGETVVQSGSKLVFEQIEYAEDEYGYPMYWEPSVPHGGVVRVLDLANPAQPKLVGAVQLPVGVGHTGLVVDGSRVLLSHWEPIEGLPGKARFYLDRIELGGLIPMRLPKINVPGSLVAYDAPSGNLLTVDYERRVDQVQTYQECYEQLGWTAWYEPNDPNDPDAWGGPGTCTSFDRSFKVVEVDETAASATLLDEHTLDTKAWVSDLVVGEDRVFFTSSDYDYQTGISESRVWAVGGIRAGELATGSRELDDAWWASPVAAKGTTLVAVSWRAVVTVDASELSALETTKLSDLPWWVESVSFDGARVLLALGPYGLAVIDTE